MRFEGLDFARKSPLPTANLHAMVKFGGAPLAVVVVVVVALLLRLAACYGGI